MPDNVTKLGVVTRDAAATSAAVDVLEAVLEEARAGHIGEVVLVYQSLDRAMTGVSHNLADPIVGIGLCGYASHRLAVALSGN